MLSVNLLKRYIERAFLYLKNNKSLLNDLNVFPVPDGDTGFNMMTTIENGIISTENRTFSSIPEYLNIFSENSLKISRGNSGVLIARFIMGISEESVKAQDFNFDIFKKGFIRGIEFAKKAMHEPKQGTMITIMEKALEAFEGINTVSKYSFRDFFARASHLCGEEILKTPEKLPILKKAGVVDAGGLGFLFIIKGFYYSIMMMDFPEEHEEAYRFAPIEDIEVVYQESIAFRYCTEFILENKDRIVKTEEVEELLNNMGDSLIVADGGDFIKIHIHTNDVGALVDALKIYGSVKALKADDMKAQKAEALKKIVKGETSILCLANAPGFKEIFNEFHVHHTLIYDSLPTVMDIMNAVNNIKRKNIIVLPNNKNIIPAIKLVIEKSNKNIKYIPSTTIPEGISALYIFNPDADMDNQIRDMTVAIGFVTTLYLFKADREQKFGEALLKENDFFVVCKDQILSVSKDPYSAIRGAIETFDISSKSAVSFYSGSIDTKLMEFKEILHCLSAKNSYLEIEVRNTGQKKELMIISIE